MTRIFRIHQDERGITGLETAIIIIAFIVVASVFAYTVLSAGLFSAQKADETVHSGVSQAQATSELRGSVLAYKGTANSDDCITKISFTVGNALLDGKAIDLTPPYYVQDDGTLKSPTLDDCDDTWSSGTATCSIDSADYREPPRSAKFTLGTGITANSIVGTESFSNVDLTIMNKISVWAKSSEARTAGDLQFRLYDGGTSGTLAATINFPALATNTWKKCSLTITDPSAAGMSTVDTVALYTTTTSVDNSEIHLDDLRTVFTDGESVTLISYSDSNIVIPETAWTVSFSGGYEDDGDFLLEDAEKAVITVWMQDYDGSTGLYSNGTNDLDPFVDDNANHLGANDLFSIQMMPSVGATLLMEKRIPAYLSPVMRLN
ncbi:MAG: hypothetical protein HQ553_17675 [Chloroflexi bacterium]|nr:hypothetical protein [Chloroflexota bacterium]